MPPLTLTPGARLGPYEILSALGAGGMGEVYRARDPRLGRDVAIKVLSAAFSADPDRLRRFEQEARAAAALNHPNILAIYDIGTDAGTIYIVSELLQGRTLREVLEDSPVAVRQAVDYAMQIAAGVAAAHDRGIVHRDLKPENVFITADARVKVLDFGLAKLTHAAAETALDPTCAVETMPGAVLGTIGYMAPEQCRGLQADARSDVFAFGAIVYEMIAGRRPFRGATAADVMTAILKEEPPALTTLNAAIPVALDKVVRRCLEKTLERRLQSIRDVAFALDTVAGFESGVPAPTTATAVKSGSARASSLTVAAGVLVVTVAIGLLVDRWARSDRLVTRPPISLAVTLPTGTRAATGLSPTFAISPDGTHLAFVATGGDRTQLYVRAMDEVDATPRAGTEGADGVFFSPDSRWVGFFADHALKKIAVAGGSPATVCEAGAGLGATWGRDDTIVFAAVPDAGLSRVSAAGGTPTPLAIPDFARGDSDYFWPEILPSGGAVLYTAFTSTGKSRIEALILRTGERRVIVDEAMNVRYSDAGFVVFGRGGGLFAAPFDAKRLQLTGAVVPVLQDVALTSIGAAQFSLSGQGTLVYVSGGSHNIDRALVWVTRAGTDEPLSMPPHVYLDPRLAADGRRLLAEIFAGPKADLWVDELDRRALSRLTFEGYESETAVWMPDNASVAFSSSRAGIQRGIFSRRVGESGGDQQLFAGHHHMHLSSASADGRVLAYTEYDPVTQGDIWLLPLSGDRHPLPFLRTPFHEWGAVFSPDGHWLAYVSNESGRDEIYIQALPAPGQKLQISTDGGREPVWARNGAEVFYRNGRKMMAVAVTANRALAAGKPQELFEGTYENGLPLGHTNYDVSPDGQRFLMIKDPGAGDPTATPANLVVALNWFEELKARVPTK